MIEGGSLGDVAGEMFFGEALMSWVVLAVPVTG